MATDEGRNRLGIIIGVVGVLIGIAGVLVAVLSPDEGQKSGKARDSSTSSEDNIAGEGELPPEPPAGDPLPAETVQRLITSANMTGADLQVEPGTGRCEVIYRVTRIIASHSDTPPTGIITEANAAAAASPNGSLYLSVSNWTDGDPAALWAVEECWPYLVGKPF
jgi:hypothetical protein